MIDFNQRSSEKEIMDDLACDGPVLDQTLKELKTINKLLGGNHVTTDGLDKITAKFPQASYTIADIGCGGGDMIRVMADWAINKNLNLHFIGVDANPNTIEFAKERLADLNNVEFLVKNVFEAGFLGTKADIITCTLFTHHFTDSELQMLLKSLLDQAKLGIVINDLHRHSVAYYSIKLLTRFFSKSDMVKNDGPLSVLRAFSRADWKELLKQSQIKSYGLKWFWAFRWQVIVWNS
ncbi:methyltransferase domain-containing protein [Belliella pelovolcani]|uniref:methyltransferase domain-containing protein n=1 Tax=Belliella pelovolcani TaxID=529505 RepID=UPI00391B044C